MKPLDIKVGSSWEAAEHYDALVVGAGPKGIAVALELQQSGMQTLLVDSAPAVGHSWSPEMIDQDLLITPGNLEVISGHDLEFSSFLRVKRRGGSPKVADLYAYLKALAEHINHMRTALSIASLDWGRRAGYASIQNGPNIICSRIVLATGLMGHGKKEFANYPEGVTSSAHVQHYPGQLKDKKDLISFIRDAKTLAIVGGNLGGLNVLEGIADLVHLEAIHILAEDGILAEGKTSVIKNLPADEDRRILAHKMAHSLKRIQKVRYNSSSSVKGITESALGTVIQFDDNDLTVDRVILATGFHYNFRALPFLKEGLLRHADIRMASDGRRPKLDEFQRLTTDQGSLPIFAIGEAAAGTFGEACRRLPSTREEISRILAGLRARI